MTPRNAWLFECDGCGFSASNLEAGSGRDVGGLEPLRRRNFERLLDRLGSRYELEGRSLFEVGCAEGWFLEAAERRGMAVSAIEPSAPHARMAAASGYAVTEGFFPADVPANAGFDVIVFNDVFEHLPDPVHAIDRCEALLRPGGVLVVNLPSNRGVIYRIASVLAKLGRPSLLERLWQKGLPSPHLTYFNPHTLRRFVHDHTALKQVDAFRLDTIARDGLLERIRVSHPGPIGSVGYVGMLLMLPAMRVLPPDIIVGIFEKRPGPAD